jgi:Integrase core domain
MGTPCCGTSRCPTSSRPDPCSPLPILKEADACTAPWAIGALLRREGLYSSHLVEWGRANQLWSWDITKLLGPVKWTYYYLYVLLDIFSRYVVGWSLGRHESAALAKTLYKRTQEGESRRVDVEMGCKVGCGV